MFIPYCPAGSVLTFGKLIKTADRCPRLLRLGEVDEKTKREE